MLMKTLLIAMFLTGAVFFSTGCATPGYSGGLPSIRFPEERANGENSNNIIRNMAFESRQLSDDFNSVFLLDPHGNLTKWNLFH
jgi:hypothetical protein